MELSVHSALPITMVYNKVPCKCFFLFNITAVSP